MEKSIRLAEAFESVKQAHSIADKSNLSGAKQAAALAEVDSTLRHLRTVLLTTVMNTFRLAINRHPKLQMADVDIDKSDIKLFRHRGSLHMAIRQQVEHNFRKEENLVHAIMSADNDFNTVPYQVVEAEVIDIGEGRDKTATVAFIIDPHLYRDVAEDEEPLERSSGLAEELEESFAESDAEEQPEPQEEDTTVTEPKSEPAPAGTANAPATENTPRTDSSGNALNGPATTTTVVEPDPNASPLENVHAQEQTNIITDEAEIAKAKAKDAEPNQDSTGNAINRTQPAQGIVEASSATDGSSAAQTSAETGDASQAAPIEETPKTDSTGNPTPAAVSQPAVKGPLDHDGNGRKGGAVPSNRKTVTTTTKRR